MAVLAMRGFDERFGHPYESTDQTADRVHDGAGYGANDGSDGYEGVGGILTVTGNNWTWNKRVLIEVDSASDRLLIGYMKRLSTSLTYQTTMFGGAAYKATAGVVIAKEFASRTSPVLIKSDGLGVDIDDSWAAPSFGSVLATWSSVIHEVIDLGAGGTRIILYFRGGIVFDEIYPDATWPAGNWTAAAHEVRHWGDFGTQFSYVDDLYVADDYPRFNAKVRTLRPSDLGFHEDWLVVGSRPGATANVPADLSTRLGTDDPGLDTAEFDAMVDDGDRPTVHAVAHTALGASDPLAVRPVLRRAGVDEPGSDHPNLPATRRLSQSILTGAARPSRNELLAGVEAGLEAH
jgi:hypothetical protein